ncbi:hypothetical protein A3F07_04020 [candidate division WWE3 bacterium RIFCSPHIGHO2_12_FULL_38_15]|uniref:DUF2797 domain-containing protein n=1 Tax=candidate division WWE3 bacterium RIFCSPHIGHO2_02_FULL_38_14 TaxID=1802620 RepID=A0A1F4V9M9_UNCKA|nr:MAG: hypothetical protein A2793_04130 [candidate division WWE3 bacterium RIFCSPHIGHO2_01_FULL_38_45]OGC49302.1 MAG: hypothetical protein A3F07_04020 [candidate division WWE3 bacterium RIFCSPHIGHO2_12_FULL_38_15]OGC52711.1 MAG: hypothetical protein A3B64_00860 [candidate division WWE3 bacterium RIFCSPLOWO2_01_FULL_37_24]OGC53905.1 MAG: hypothetical protein A3D91_03915 [candidate division WWE3 bacterium RIFCSPHIGHO2_02_FULL_38_14]HLB51398.1 DUF2797 domain-containing protein [Patescibacteria gr
MNYLVLDYLWSDKVPYLVLCEKASKYIIRREINNLAFSWNVSSYRKCPGYMNLLTGKHFLCTENTDMTGMEFERCKSCEVKTGFRDGFVFHIKDINKTAQKYFQHEHYLYLAFFSPNHFKVGTTNIIRKFDRLYEQGAYAFCFFASAIGLKVVEIERYISGHFYIPERLTNKVKFELIKNNIQPPDLLESLKEKHRVVAAVLGATEFKEYLWEKPEFNIIQNSQVLNSENIRNCSLLDDFSQISGTVLGVKGSYIIFENAGSLYAIKGRKLVGRTIEELNNGTYIVVDKYQLRLDI